ncbi:MAG: Eco57I restriction-modification methylase domain-containing protein [Burkholderiales bacterium]
MVAVATAVPRDRQRALGQFLTAAPLAEFMAAMFEPLPSIVRLLDAGAGAGALTSAFVSRLCEGIDGVRAVEVTLYELDPLILRALDETMRECERRCAVAGIRFTFTVHTSSFVEDVSKRLRGGLFETSPPQFDAAIVNPPYRKIGTDSVERRALHSIGVETSNLYTGFIALIHRLLVPGGQIVAITPRSFCNGPYFRTFREDFLSEVELRRIHVFESRHAAFQDDNVLQENIIFHGVKGTTPPAEMTISSSSGKHGDAVSEMVIPFDQVVHPRDAERFIHIPSGASHAAVKRTMDGLHSSLAALGLTVSTGRVVDFRLKEDIRKDPEPGTVPLIYSCHFNGNSICWPKTDARKPNAIVDNSRTRPWLVPKGMYVLTKRFTSKEEPRRLVACLLDPDHIDAEWIGLENHLNYFHSNGQGLEPILAMGLYAYLNSTVVDQYFRRFSGHTQVNATDLRSVPYPELGTLRAIGSYMPNFNISQDAIDELVGGHLHASR